jgi:hypothetical protein
MALSDACFDFLQATADAAEVLAAAVHHYAAPDYPIPYGGEIDALRRACAALRERPYDPASGADLLRLAASVMIFHDTPPDTPERWHREAEMKRLVSLLQENLDSDDGIAVPAVVGNVLLKRDLLHKRQNALKPCCQSSESRPMRSRSRSSAISVRRRKKNAGPLSPMCNLYSITTNQAAIMALFQVMNRYVGNLPRM